MRLILLIFFSLMTSSSTTFAQDGIPELVEAIENGRPAIVGWWHAIGNQVVPNLVYRAIEKARSNTNRQIVFLVEIPAGHVPYVDESERTAFEYLEKLNVEVVSADLSNRDSFPNYGMVQRDLHFATQIKRLAANGKSVVLLVGANHLPGIKNHLKAMGILATFIHTWIDPGTLAVLAPGKVLGFADAEDPLLQHISWAKGLFNPASRWSIFISKIWPVLSGKLNCEALLTNNDMREPTIGPGPIQLTPRFKTPEEVIHWIEVDQKLWCVWTVFKVGEEG